MVTASTRSVLQCEGQGEGVTGLGATCASKGLMGLPPYDFSENAP